MKRIARNLEDKILSPFRIMRCQMYFKLDGKVGDRLRYKVGSYLLATSPLYSWLNKLPREMQE